MNKEEIKNILDKANISVIDELNILEYIDELEKVKEEYIKSLDELDVLDNRIDKAIEYIEEHRIREKCIVDVNALEGILNESNRK